MKLVVFGLTVSSSWGNGHATLWRALIRALARRGHHVVFFERDVPYYSSQRDLWELPGGKLQLYADWQEAAALAGGELRDADVAMVTSYCPDGVSAAELLLGSNAKLKVFYDLDTPVTLNQLENGEPVSYLPPQGLGDFDLVLSYTGGTALDELKSRLGARRVAPLYGSVDPNVHFPVSPVGNYRADLSYLGTYAQDRQTALCTLFIEPARRLPERRFLIGGAMYPHSFPWTSNIYFVRHLPPGEHAAFYSSSRLTLNITRQAMANKGYCPSGRLFEAAACGCPILSDWWEGLDEFFTPGEQILIAHSSQEAVEALEASDAFIRRVGHNARRRALEDHSADHRARDLENALQSSLTSCIGA